MRAILGLVLLAIAYGAPVDYSNVTRYLGHDFTDEQNYEYAIKHEEELKKLHDLQASEGPYEEIIHHVGNYTDEEIQEREKLEQRYKKEQEELQASKKRYETWCLRTNEVPEEAIEDYFAKGLKKFCMGFMYDDVLDRCRTWFRTWNLTEKFGYDLGYKGEIRTVLRIWNEDIVNNSSMAAPDRLPWIGRVIDVARYLRSIGTPWNATDDYFDEDNSNYYESERLFQRIKRWGRNWDIKETEFLRYNATSNTIYRADTTEKISELIGEMRDKGVPEAAIKEYVADGVEYDFGLVRSEESWKLLDNWWEKWNIRRYLRYELAYDTATRKVFIARDLHSY